MMRPEEARYRRWLAAPHMDPELYEELKQMEDQPEEIAERFDSRLTFGTGGMRGEMGAGTNRLNIYTVRQATLGLAYYLHSRKDAVLNPIQGREKNGEGGSTSSQREQGAQQDPSREVGCVVIAYDSRHRSDRFALEAALTLAKQGIKAYLFPQLAPTPQLSFAVRRLKADAGIMITASHNPPEYNGYKVYGPDGAQLNLTDAEELLSHIDRVEDELAVPVMDQEEAVAEGWLTYLDEEMDRAYSEYVASLLCQPQLVAEEGDQLKILFTPLHGTAGRLVPAVLAQAGFKQVELVKAQQDPDPHFSTVNSPNPEEVSAFALAMEQAEESGADLIMGTDPDADRMGVVVRDQEGRFRLLTGNQTGALLLHYLLTQKQAQGLLTPEHTICKTIVTSELGRVIGRRFGLETIDTLTGFKFIGEQIRQFESTGRRRFLFGYEESYGYLIGDDVRDKDGIQAVLLCAEMALYYKTKGLTLYDALLALYEEYGYFLEDLLSVTLKGREGKELIKETMASLRRHPPDQLANLAVTVVEDYADQRRYDVQRREETRLALPRAEVVKLILEDGSWLCLRPSGTEPKLKLYLGVQASTLSAAEEKLERLRAAAQGLLPS